MFSAKCFPSNVRHFLDGGVFRSIGNLLLLVVYCLLFVVCCLLLLLLQVTSKMEDRERERERDKEKDRETETEQLCIAIVLLQALHCYSFFFAMHDVLATASSRKC